MTIVCIFFRPDLIEKNASQDDVQQQPQVEIATITKNESQNHFSILFTTEDTNEVKVTQENVNNQANRFPCQFETCNRTYSTLGNLRTHLKTHKGNLNV